MNSNQVKGAVKDAAGKARRKMGDAIDSPTEQIKGAAQQVAGKAQKAVGNVQEAVDTRPSTRKG